MANENMIFIDDHFKELQEAEKRLYESTLVNSVEDAPNESCGEAILHAGRYYHLAEQFFHDVDARTCLPDLTRRRGRHINPENTLATVNRLHIRRESRLPEVDTLEEPDLSAYLLAVGCVHTPIASMLSVRSASQASTDEPFESEERELRAYDERGAVNAKVRQYLDHLRYAFHLSNQGYEEYTQQNQSSYHRRLQVLVDELEAQERDLDVNCLDTYKPDHFQFLEAYDVWRQDRKKILLELLSNLSGRSPSRSELPAFRAKNEEFRSLLRRLMGYDVRNFVDDAYRRILTDASNFIIREFRLRHAVNDIFETLVQLQFLLEEDNFVLTVGFLYNIFCLVQDLETFILHCDPQDRKITITESQFLKEIIDQLDLVIRQKTIESEDLMHLMENTQTNGEGLKFVFDITLSVHGLKCVLGHAPRQDDVSEKLQKNSLKKCCMVMYETNMEARCRRQNGTLSGSDISFLIEFSRARAEKLYKHLDPILEFDVCSAIRNAFYAKLMGNVVDFFDKKIEATLENTCIYREDIALMSQLHRLDQDWSSDISKSLHLWRELAFKLTTQWLTELQRSCEEFIKNSFKVSTFKTSIINCYCAREASPTPSSSSPQWTPVSSSLVVSPNSAFSPGGSTRCSSAGIFYSATSNPSAASEPSSTSSNPPSTSTGSRNFKSVPPKLPVVSETSSDTVTPQQDSSLYATPNQSTDQPGPSTSAHLPSTSMVPSIIVREWRSRNNSGVGSQATGSNCEARRGSSPASKRLILGNSSAMVDIIAIFQRFCELTDNILDNLIPSEQMMLSEDHLRAPWVELLSPLWSRYAETQRKICVEMVLYLAENIVWLDLCGVPLDKARRAFDQGSLRALIQARNGEKVWGCRHITEKREHKDFPNEKALTMMQKYEPITLMMIVRLNDLACLKKRFSDLISPRSLRHSGIPSGDLQEECEMIDQKITYYQQGLVEVLAERLNLFISNSMDIVFKIDPDIWLKATSKASNPLLTLGNHLRTFRFYLNQEAFDAVLSALGIRFLNCIEGLCHQLWTLQNRTVRVAGSLRKFLLQALNDFSEQHKYLLEVYPSSMRRIQMKLHLFDGIDSHIICGIFLLHNTLRFLPSALYLRDVQRDFARGDSFTERDLVNYMVHNNRPQDCGAEWDHRTATDLFHGLLRSDVISRTEAELIDRSRNSMPSSGSSTPFTPPPPEEDIVYLYQFSLPLPFDESKYFRRARNIEQLEMWFATNNLSDERYRQILSCEITVEFLLQVVRARAHSDLVSLALLQKLHNYGAQGCLDERLTLALKGFHLKLFERTVNYMMRC